MPLRTDISNSAYHASGDLSRSVADKITTSTPKQVWHDMQHPTPSDAPHFVVGGCTHMATLEPFKLDDEYAVKPESIDGNSSRTNAYKAPFQTMQDHAPAKRWLAPSDYRHCMNMAAEAREHPIMQTYLEDPESVIEGTGFFEHEGADCKVRPDLWNPGGGVVVDLKTTQSASEKDFARSVIKFSYHFQACWYLHGLRLMGENPKQFIFVCVEKTAPYLTNAFTLSVSDIDRQKSRMSEACKLWATCMDSGVWPGYSDEVKTLNLGNNLNNRLSISEIADKFEVSRSYVYRILKDHTLETRNIGNRRTIDMADFAQALRFDSEGRAA